MQQLCIDGFCLCISDNNLSDFIRRYIGGFQNGGYFRIFFDHFCTHMLMVIGFSFFEIGKISE